MKMEILYENRRKIKKKILMALVTFTLIGCSSLEMLNNKLDEYIARTSIKDTSVPQFKRERVSFGSYSANLSKTYIKELKSFSGQFKSPYYYTSEHKILLKGYIDSLEKEEGFSNLGKQRANMIKNFLISQGIDSNKIIIINFGGKEYLYSNKTAIGKAKNRSVKIEIIRYYK